MSSSTLKNCSASYLHSSWFILHSGWNMIWLLNDPGISLEYTSSSKFAVALSLIQQAVRLATVVAAPGPTVLGRAWHKRKRHPISVDVGVQGCCSFVAALLLTSSLTGHVGHCASDTANNHIARPTGCTCKYELMTTPASARLCCSACFVESSRLSYATSATRLLTIASRVSST